MARKLIGSTFVLRTAVYAALVRHTGSVLPGILDDSGGPTAPPRAIVPGRNSLERNPRRYTVS